MYRCKFVQGVYSMERFIRQTVCKFEPKINCFMNVQVKGGFKTKTFWDGENLFLNNPIHPNTLYILQ